MTLLMVHVSGKGLLDGNQPPAKRMKNGSERIDFADYRIGWGASHDVVSCCSHLERHEVLCDGSSSPGCAQDPHSVFSARCRGRAVRSDSQVPFGWFRIWTCVVVSFSHFSPLLSFDAFQKALKCRPQDIQRLKSGYKRFISKGLGRSLSGEQILADLRAAGLSDDIAKGSADVIVSRQEEARLALALKPSCGPYLKDYDWKTSLTVASDTFASLSVPVTTFALEVAQPMSDLEVAENVQESSETVIVEMNQSELTRFVQQLENIAVVMRDVSI